ncbi:MAG: ring,2-phenylacetyl-CoA epoxidase subunit PaaA [Pseudonocardiales bacterium]|jgi:ring-1,2-phenylacetyl-CoA epoxidase subunit PaaA|nr:ring,2-phenylacetyl-CoA epoxidase subunit PaaA [Pseudonocardiales bacterium]
MLTRLRETSTEGATISAEEIHQGRDITAAELDRTPREYQELIVRMLVGHAQGEAFVLYDDFYAKWAADAPTAQHRFTVLRTIEEELMHAREGWKLLRQIRHMVEIDDLVPYQVSTREGFQHGTKSWGEHAALCALTDRVGCFQQEEQLDCSYAPYAEAIRDAYFPYEKRHAGRGRHWLQELCETEEGRREAQEAVDVWWPRALDMFGRSETPRQHRFIYFRLKTRTNEERRQAYIEVVGPELEKLGLTVPDVLKGRLFL